MGVQTRPLYEVAAEVRRDWVDPKTGKSRVYFGAVPYLDAMATLNSVNDRFYEDPAKDVVVYFLSNATTWRGDTARRVKAELKALVK